MVDEPSAAGEADAPGRARVGVCTVAVERADGTPLPVEVWYPAAPAAGVEGDADEEDAPEEDAYQVVPGMIGGRQAACRDAPPLVSASGAPLVVFSHGMAGHRRQSTFLCTHLASQGAVVASPDHVGNTLAEMLPLFLPLDEAAIEAVMIESAGHRPTDIARVVDRLLVDAPIPIDADAVSLCGHSFGGWTVLQATAADARIRRVVGLAPGGGRDGRDDVAAAFLDLDWGRSVPTLLIAADGDSVLPLAGMYDLAARIESPVELVVLSDTDHYHFCDDAEQQHELVRGLPGAGSGMAPFDQLAPAAGVAREIRTRTAAHLLG